MLRSPPTCRHDAEPVDFAATGPERWFWRPDERPTIRPQGGASMDDLGRRAGSSGGGRSPGRSRLNDRTIGNAASAPLAARAQSGVSAGAMQLKFGARPSRSHPSASRRLVHSAPTANQTVTPFRRGKFPAGRRKQRARRHALPIRLHRSDSDTGSPPCGRFSPNRNDAVGSRAAECGYRARPSSSA